jgi:hypothetical protein
LVYRLSHVRMNNAKFYTTWRRLLLYRNSGAIIAGDRDKTEAKSV